MRRVKIIYCNWCATQARWEGVVAGRRCGVFACAEHKENLKKYEAHFLPKPGEPLPKATSNGDY